MTEPDSLPLCTLDELTELVEAALAVDYQGAPTGRVRDVPDQRAIRWYVTRGLVDRPAGSRGRVALYGRRHLLQLVAIKRLQARGRSLAEIQAELTGATDDALTRVARIPADIGGVLSSDATAVAPPMSRQARRRPPNDAPPGPPLPRLDMFWAARRLDGRAVTPEDAAVAAAAADHAAAADKAERSGRPGPADTAVDVGEARAATDATGSAADPGRRAVPPGRSLVDLVHIQALRLAPGITLLIDDGTADPAAVAAAAQPLLDLLAAHGGAARSQEES